MYQLQAAALYQKIDLRDAQRSAETLARRAVALDGADAEARSCLGWALQARGEADDALAEIEQALSMSPNLAIAHGHRGATLIFAERLKDGVAALKTCIRLDPRDPYLAVRFLHIACGLYFCSEYEASIEAAKRLIRSYPDFPMIYRWSAAALGQLGRERKRRKNWKRPSYAHRGHSTRMSARKLHGFDQKTTLISSKVCVRPGGWGEAAPNSLTAVRHGLPVIYKRMPVIWR